MAIGVGKRNPSRTPRTVHARRDVEIAAHRGAARGLAGVHLPGVGRYQGGASRGGERAGQAPQPGTSGTQGTDAEHVRGAFIERRDDVADDVLGGARAGRLALGVLAVPVERELVIELAVQEHPVGNVGSGIGLPDGGGAALLGSDGQAAGGRRRRRGRSERRRRGRLRDVAGQVDGDDRDGVPGGGRQPGDRERAGTYRSALWTAAVDGYVVSGQAVVVSSSVPADHGPGRSDFADGQAGNVARRNQREQAAVRGGVRAPVLGPDVDVVPVAGGPITLRDSRRWGIHHVPSQLAGRYRRGSYRREGPNRGLAGQTLPGNGCRNTVENDSGVPPLPV